MEAIKARLAKRLRRKIKDAVDDAVDWYVERLETELKAHKAKPSVPRRPKKKPNTAALPLPPPPQPSDDADDAETVSVHSLDPVDLRVVAREFVLLNVGSQGSFMAASSFVRAHKEARAVRSDSMPELPDELIYSVLEELCAEGRLVKEEHAAEGSQTKFYARNEPDFVTSILSEAMGLVMAETGYAQACDIYKKYEELSNARGVHVLSYAGMSHRLKRMTEDGELEANKADPDSRSCPVFYKMRTA